MNPYNICDEDSPEENHKHVVEITTKNELVVNALLNDASTVINNIVDFNDKQIAGFQKHAAKQLSKATAFHDEFISDLISAASNALQGIIGETQVQTDMLASLFHGVAGQPSVPDVETKIDVGSVGPQVDDTSSIPPQAVITNTVPVAAITGQSPQIPPPYTSVVGGQSTVSVSVNPLLSQSSPQQSSQDQGTNVAFAPVVTNTTTILRQAVEHHRERKLKRKQEDEPVHPAGYPIDPVEDPIAWRFAPDDKGWRQKSADFLGPEYDLLLQVGSMREYQSVLDNMLKYPEG